MPGRVFRPRQRRSVRDIYDQLGDVYFCRAYQMKYRTFQNLASMLRQYIIAASGKKENSRNFVPNGHISSDVRGRILNISMIYPRSTSDCLAFEGMTLFQKLESGILAPGLCLFGDNAYLNTSYMTTPYAAVSGGSKDAYNFYHSQLQIRIECTFGIFTHRWSILRSAIPMNVSVRKTVALVRCLAKLHNYCIDADDTDILLSTTLLSVHVSLGSFIKHVLQKVWGPWRNQGIRKKLGDASIGKRLENVHTCEK